MQCIKLYLLTMTWCSILPPSSQCLSQYITRAIDSYHCQSSSFMSISNIRFQQCTRACLINSTCWTLSYNHSGHVCVLGEEACITANNSNDFSMMIIRTDSSQRCVEWMPFNMTYGVNYGYPKRAIKAGMGQDKVSTVARRVTSDGLQIRKSTSFRYKAYVLDLRQNRHAIDYGDEILLVGNSCSTAWVSLFHVPNGFVGGLSKYFGQGLWLADLNADVVGQSTNKHGVAKDFPHHVTVSSSFSARFLYGFPYRFQRAWTVLCSMKHTLDVVRVGAWNSLSVGTLHRWRSHSHRSSVSWGGHTHALYRWDKGHKLHVFHFIQSRCSPGPRLNIKTVLSMYGDFHVKDKTAVRTSYL